MNRPSAPCVLAIGGMDPSCGAGILADVRTLDAFGVVPLAVTTAITVQAGKGVRAVHPVAAARVRAQLMELLGTFALAAVKVGQVPGPACARMLAEVLEHRAGHAPLVLDPVLRASGGGRLASPAAARAIVRHLVPRAALVTVNLDEAEALTGLRVRTADAMSVAARAIAAHGAAAVVIKGGHLRGPPLDLLLHRGRERRLGGKRLRGSMHGTGCAFASAAAASLACGASMEEAVAAARDHVRALLAAAVDSRGVRLRPPAPMR
ncbi:MAG TPA: hydroxymethylpyrimidine/phosphomethylpyrimidine kinase [Candidatus Binatia bacterium]|nr:hydroxymethylpyrimidine/phosphomethylpyrimidine kinase [Candidatus Binatia bacterium]